jgi:hypothetical protein
VTDIFYLRGGDNDGMIVGVIASPMSNGCRSELKIGGESTVMDGKVFLTPKKGFLNDPCLIGKTEQTIRGKECHLFVNNPIHTPEGTTKIYITQGGKLLTIFGGVKNILYL